ncbi:MAG: NifU family protein [Chlorobi bacterium]|nr:NifU family protein [Chlorobiota bacterium]
MEEQKSELYREVETALNEIRPYLQADGGDIELIDVTDDYIVKVRLQGSCYGCPMSLQTLKGGVEVAIKRAVPQITEVISVE